MRMKKMNIIDLMEANSRGRQYKDTSHIFDSTPQSILTIKKNFKKIKKSGEYLTNIDFSKGVFVYIAQRMTGCRTKPSARHWTNRLKTLNEVHNKEFPDTPLTLLDPWDFNMSKICGVQNGVLEPCIDYAIVHHANAVIIDFTRGISVGATAEIMCANDRGGSVIGVKKLDQQLSVFTQRHVNYWLSPKGLLHEATTYVDWPAALTHLKNAKYFGPIGN